MAIAEAIWAIAIEVRLHDHDELMDYVRWLLDLEFIASAEVKATILRVLAAIV